MSAFLAKKTLRLEIKFGRTIVGLKSPYKNVKEKESEGFNLTLQMIAERNIAVKEQLNRSAPKPED